MRYLTFTDLRAKLCGRSRSAIYLDIEAQRLPKPIKLGGKLYWPETEVDEWLLQQREVSACRKLRPPSHSQIITG